MYVKQSNYSYDKMIENIQLVKYNENVINSLIRKSGECISRAKAIHMNIEKRYIENMDFEGLTKYLDCVMENIIERAK